MAEPAAVAELHKLVFEGATEQVVELVSGSKDKVALLESREEDTLSPLERSAIWGHTETLAALLSLSADPTGCDPLGYTALHRAAMWGHVDCIDVLCNHTTADGPLSLETRTQASSNQPQGETAHELAKRYGKQDSTDQLEAVVNRRKVEAEQKAAEAAAKEKKSQKKKK